MEAVGKVLGDTHTHRGQEAVNCYETSLLGGDLWDTGGSKSVIAVQSKHKMEREGGRGADQRQIAVRCIIN